MGLSVIETSKRKGSRVEAAYRMSMEEISWCKKARKKWIKGGNRNTVFFNCVASHRRRCNYAEDLIVYDNTISGNQNMREAARLFFSELHRKDWKTIPKFDNLNFK